jgi:hypothetical protein
MGEMKKKTYKILVRKFDCLVDVRVNGRTESKGLLKNGMRTCGTD